MPTTDTCDLVCLNGGSCFLNARKQAKCRCQPRYNGEKCQINQCWDYCQNGGMCAASPSGEGCCGGRAGPGWTGQGSGALTALFSGMPTCRCPTGFTGPRCNQQVCTDYCLNNGSCTVNQGNQPNCRCLPSFIGDRCQYRECCSRGRLGTAPGNWGPLGGTALLGDALQGLRGGGVLCG